MSTIVPYSNWKSSGFQVQIARMISQGWRIEHLTPTQVVLVSGKRCDHILHLLITLLLCGFWFPVWIVLAIVQQETRTTGTLLPNGQVFWS